ncbi:hypothetical protein PA01_06685 [Azoarcus sp. PA01]|nr:hypothetical protein PA01_06685 [Azoarcus sp. PA01]
MGLERGIERGAAPAARHGHYRPLPTRAQTEVDSELRFFGQPVLGSNLAGRDIRDRARQSRHVIRACGKLLANAGAA